MGVAALWNESQSRGLLYRALISVDFVLTTPCHIGSGDLSDVSDLPIVASSSGVPVIPGSGIAGALRAYLHRQGISTVELMGTEHGQGKPGQSRLSVFDAVVDPNTVRTSRWRGNRIATESRTADQGALYDMDALDAGTHFNARFKLVAKNKDEFDDLKRRFGKALSGLMTGEIRLGRAKSGGFGQAEICRVCANEFDLTTHIDQWIECTEATTEVKFDEYFEAEPSFDPHRVRIDATFAVAETMLTGDGWCERADHQPDMVQKRARTKKLNTSPTVTGKTIRGRMKAQALKIARTRGDEDVAQQLIKMFGSSGRASRVRVGFAWVENGRDDLVIPSIKIDRLTGGVVNGALFWSNPVTSDLMREDSRATMCVTIELLPCQVGAEVPPVEIGLLLQCVKDMWTQRMNLGKASMNGRLQGLEMRFSYRMLCVRLTSESQADRFTSPKFRCETGNLNELEKYAKAFSKAFSEVVHG